MLRAALGATGALLMITLTPAIARQTAETEHQVVAAHAASCAAYFYSAAYANGVSQYESFYGAGEYSFNLAVTATDEGQALASFNQASKEINQLMGKSWTDFHKVTEHYEPKCEKLMRASQQKGET